MVVPIPLRILSRLEVCWMYLTGNSSEQRVWRPSPLTCPSPDPPNALWRWRTVRPRRTPQLSAL